MTFKLLKLYFFPTLKFLLDVGLELRDAGHSSQRVSGGCTEL